MDQRSEIGDGIREMPSPFVLMAFGVCMLAHQVEEHGLKASEPGEVEIFLTRHAGR
jgi:hypothetical protein